MLPSCPGVDLFIPGTSTDVSRYAGQYEHVFETTTAGVMIQAPQVIVIILIHVNEKRLKNMVSSVLSLCGTMLLQLLLFKLKLL